MFRVYFIFVGNLVNFRLIILYGGFVCFGFEGVSLWIEDFILLVGVIVYILKLFVCFFKAIKVNSN